MAYVGDGRFGPASKARAKLRALVPARRGEPPRAAAMPSGSTRAGRVPWAELLRRMFAEDVLCCPRGGRRSVVALVSDATVARSVLRTLGLARPFRTYHAGVVCNRGCGVPGVPRQCLSE
jgi:hypothetical protein